MENCFLQLFVAVMNSITISLNEADVQINRFQATNTKI